MEKKVYQANSVLLAASAGLTVFWILNIFKETYPGVKAVLNFYPPVGPLLGLFLVSMAAMAVAYYLILKIKPKNQMVGFFVFSASAIIFALMVFPPIFEPLIKMLQG